jgi:hypothetical protein
VPETVEGISLLNHQSREYLYGEFRVGDLATRMIRNKRYKLVYYAIGNRKQVFDLVEDPFEMCNVAEGSDYKHIVDGLVEKLIQNLYAEDLEWVENGELVGLPDKEYVFRPNRDLTAQRGLRFM